MLTKKQHELLGYIHRHLTERGVSPSFDEMKAALGLKSKSGIHRLLTALEERGFVRRMHHRARAVEVLRLPQNMGAPGGVAGAAKGAAAPAPAAAVKTFTPRVIAGAFPSAASSSKESAEPGEVVPLPLYGRIAAGTPIEALRDPGASIDVPAELLGSGEHYALEVDGDSMIEAGILDGDTVIIERSEVAENGAVVVALIDEAEVTLKRIRRRSGAIALEPANRQHEIRIFPPERVRIQGRLKALVRRY